MLSKWGYTGGGLGQGGNGIVSPIKLEPAVKSNALTWPKNTTLIIGDSMLNGIEESRLRRYNAKVEAFPGAKIKDMYGFIAPSLSKKPSMVILHVGTNDAPFKPADIIVKELLILRQFIENRLPTAKIILSSPIMRTDNKSANGTIQKIVEDELVSVPNVIFNNKIDAFCLGKKGLHLNKKGCGKLATNFISKMQCV